MSESGRRLEPPSERHRLQKRIRHQRAELKRMGRFIARKDHEMTARALYKHVKALNEATAAMQGLTNDDRWRSSTLHGMKLARFYIQQAGATAVVIERLDAEIARLEGKKL